MTEYVTMAQFEELKQAVAVDARNLDIAWIVLCSECLLRAFAAQRLRPRIVTVASTLGTTRVLTLAYRNTLAATLIFFMQAGFAMLEAGIVHPKNVTNILFKNMIDASLAAFIFWAIGYGIAYGKC